MSRFPKLTETFVFLEIVALEEMGFDIQIFPLLRERTAVIHPEVAPLIRRAYFHPFLSLRIVCSQLHFLFRRPRIYLHALLDVLRASWGDLNLFVGSLVIFPKVVHTARICEGLGVEHVHCHFANHPTTAGLVVWRLTGIPYSFTVHGFDVHVRPQMLREKVAEAAFVIAISNYNRDLILEECGGRWGNRVKVIHCGVDTGFFHPNGGRSTARPFKILCVAGLTEVKGHQQLISACRMLVSDGVDFVCELVGDGPLREKLQTELEAEGLLGHVKLLGPKPRESVAALMQSTDVVVAPSVWTAKGDREGIPVALMEAMATGVPVVASNLSGIPELVTDEVDGLLVPAGDPVALAGALRRLHDNQELRERLGRAARQTVLRGFDIRTNAALLASEIQRKAAA